MGFNTWRACELESLCADQTMVTDGGLAHLEETAAALELGLAYTDVSDVGLEQLAVLPLRSLDLLGTNVTDAGIEHLRRMSSLRA